MITKADRELYLNQTDRIILTRKIIGGLTNDALQLWIECATQQHPIFLALMTLVTADGRATNPDWLRIQLIYETYDRGIIDDCDVDRLVA